MTNDDKRNQLINDARWRRLNNFLSNWTPTTPSITPTTNNSFVWWAYWWNPRSATNLEWSTIRWWYVTYNPQNVWNYSATNWTYQPFSVADTLAQRAQWYQAQWLDWLANSYRTLNRENNAYNTTANKITDYYTALANDINSRENALAQRKESLANQLSQDIANQRQYVMDMFGPNWILTNEINKYYDENGNYLASEAGRQMAMANAEWIQSGASLWAQRAARNEAYNNAFQNYLKTKEQEIAAKTSIAQQLVSFMKALREEYGNTQNTYVISQYQRANDLLNAISNNLANTQASLAQYQLQRALAWNWTDKTRLVAEAIYRLEQNEYPDTQEWETQRNMDALIVTANKWTYSVDEGNKFLFNNEAKNRQEERYRNKVDLQWWSSSLLDLLAKMNWAWI